MASRVPVKTLETIAIDKLAGFFGDIAEWVSKEIIIQSEKMNRDGSEYRYSPYGTINEFRQFCLTI